MKPTIKRQSAALTLIEVLVVVFIIGILAVALAPQLMRKKKAAQRIACVFNLKNIGVAYRVWGNDHGNKYPANTSISEGGWKDLLSNQDAGAFCWTNYFLMTNELDQNPRVLVCPQDERIAATNFTALKNTHLSYFVGAGASGSYPQSILGGDRNLVRGYLIDSEYGLSLANGLGNDVAIQTNSIADPFTWSQKLHSKSNSPGAANILLGDASVQQLTSKRFRTDYQPNALDTGNWSSNHIPTVPSFRLIFP